MIKRHVTIIGTSLDPNSRSQLLAQEAHRQLAQNGISSVLLDLRHLNLPHMGSAGCWDHASIAPLKEEISRATHLLLAVPIYNYAVSAGTKNMIELIGSPALKNKTVGFLCASGGPKSYMAILNLANSLMLDFHCWVVPRFVYASGSDFEGDKIKTQDVLDRIAALTHEMFTHDMGE